MGCCESTYDRMEEPELPPEPAFDPGAETWSVALYRAKDLSEEQIDHWAGRERCDLEKLFQVFEQIERKPTPFMIELLCCEPNWDRFKNRLIFQHVDQKARERCLDAVPLFLKYAPKRTSSLLHAAVHTLQDIPTIEMILKSPHLKSIDEQLLAEAKFEIKNKRISKLLEAWKAKHDNASAGSSTTNTCS